MNRRGDRTKYEVWNDLKVAQRSLVAHAQYAAIERRVHNWEEMNRSLRTCGELVTKRRQLLDETKKVRKS